MGVFSELIGKFLKEDGLALGAFVGLALAVYPLESILIPSNAGKLAGKIKDDLPGNEKDRKTVIKTITKQIFTLLAMYIFAIVIHTVSNLLVSRLIPNFKEMLKNEIYERLVKKSEENFEEIPSGKVLFRIQRTANAMSDVAYYVLGSLLPLIIVLISVCVYMIRVNRKLGISCVLLVSAFFLAFYLMSKNLVDVSEQAEAVHEKTLDEWQNKMSNMLNIVVTNSAERETQENTASQKRDSQASRKKMRAESLFRTIFSMFGVVLFSTLALMSFSEYKKGKLKGAQFASVGIVSLMVSNMLAIIAGKSPKYLSDLGLVQNAKPFLESLWKAAPAADDGLADLPPNEEIKGLVEFRNVDFAYPPPGESKQEEAGRPKLVLRQFNLVIRPGEKVAIFGTSGSGKTTVAKLLLGLKQPQSGSILLDGIDLSKVKRSQIRRVVSMSNQQMTLFHGSVLENFKYGLEDSVTDEDVEALLERYSLGGLFSNLEKGIRSEVGIDGRSVSHGMQKTVMNVRSLLRARSAPVVILDEPLAGLDDATRASTSRLITDLTRGKTVIIISHHPEISKIVDRVLDLAKARARTPA